MKLALILSRMVATSMAVGLAACGSTPTQTGSQSPSDAGPQQAAADQEQSSEQPSGATQEPAPGTMVRPESLPQGFIIVADDPQRIANASDPITIGSIWGGWDPSNPAFEMEPRSDSRWQLELNGEGKNGSFAWKFTRGNWDTVEMSPEGEQIDNRLLPEVDASLYADGSKPIFEYTIAKWIDQLPNQGVVRGVEDVNVALETASRAERLQITGGAGRASSIEPRDAIVWLPPGYDAPENADRRYPVLYMLDGQNLFQRPEGQREWLLDEVANAMITIGEIEPMVIVGIPHAGDYRADEYLPLPVIDGVDASAEAFVGLLEYEVIPRVERAFRVSTRAQDRFIGGASLGAIAAMYAATERPGVFAGGVLAESPSLLVGDGSLRTHFMGVTSWPERVYIGMGGAETGPNTEDSNEDRNQAYVDAADELADYVRGQGVATELNIVPGQEHNETAWGQRLATSLRFLFPAN